MGGDIIEGAEQEEEEGNEVDEMGSRDEDEEENDVETKQKVIRAPITKQFYGESFYEQLGKYPTFAQSKNTATNISASQTLTVTLPPDSILAPFPATLLPVTPHLFNPKSL